MAEHYIRIFALLTLAFPFGLLLDLYRILNLIIQALDVLEHGKHRQQQDGEVDHSKGGAHCTQLCHCETSLWGNELDANLTMSDPKPV